MKKTLLLALFLILIAAAFTFKSHQSIQTNITNYYYFQGEKFYYSHKPDMVFVKFHQTMNAPAIKQMLEKFSEIDAEKTFSYNDRAFVKTKYPLNDASYLSLVERMEKDQNIESAGYTFTPLNYDDEKTFYGMSDEFIVQFKDFITASDAASINRQYNADVVEQISVSGGLTYLMKVRENSRMTAIDVSNKYYTDGYVNYAEPDLYCTNTLCDTTNDQFHYLQWALRNTGFNVPTNPPGVIADCDMDIDSAWMNSFGGDSTIKIAVIDTGVDTNHLDLVNNMTHGLGWDYADNDPWPYDLGAHGTSCAGIAAAQGNNTIGIAGVAFKCKIVPIRAIGGISAYHGYAYSFIRAWQFAGADVITNSWGQVGGASSLLYNAISDAARFGRGGKGCVITVASGNENGTMRFPAIVHPDIIVVGGLAPCNKRKSPTDGCSGETWGASYGSNLDLVSPCVKIYATTVGGGYTSSFNGTSSATPNAAGVCALLLSKNPNLTRTELESYLYTTCEKVGTYNYDSARTYGMWNQEMGYGRINARLAMNLMLTQIDKTAPVIYHDAPILFDTGGVARQVNAIIKDNRKLASGGNAPRLYYRVNNGSFNFLNAFQVSGDTFKFTIPAQTPVSIVEYYFAAQDTVAPANISTLPNGGSGINPPGSVAPLTFFKYNVGYYYIANSTSAPKICNNNSTIYDTIIVPFIHPLASVTDINVKVNVSHRTDSDVDLYLIKGASLSELTSDNGSSGDSYVNTIFDDSASIPVISGTAPFTGRYRPEMPLTPFNVQSPSGTYILRMDDDASGDFGTLDSWQLEIKYSLLLGGIHTINIPSKFALYQNYPNPFNPVTKIRYDVPKESNVKITVFDLLGREIEVLVSGNLEAGVHYTEFNSTELASGIYFYKMESSSFTDIKKMVVIK